MKMAGRTVSLDEKIKKAEATVIALKAKYDAALDELEKMVEKQKQLEDKKVLEAYHNGGKTADEIIAFIMSGEDKPEEDEKPKKRRKRI
jgi:hypothetical protein